jgi:hypothetical protein
MKYVDAPLAIGIEFLVTYAVIWDVVQFFLAQDLKSSFNLSSENIIFEDKIVPTLISPLLMNRLARSMSATTDKHLASTPIFARTTLQWVRWKDLDRHTTVDP